MFTGIIEEIGTVSSVRGGRLGVVLDIDAEKVLEGTVSGDSIAVNGVCLTVEPRQGGFTADVMPETVRRTSLEQLRPGSKVNLERAMPCNGRFGGHIVSGHVDVCGRVISIEREGNASVMSVSAPPQVLRYVVEKGSVTLDGVSLTVTGVHSESLSVSLIPHTAAATTLGLLRPGSPVNIEVDVLAKYVERFVTGNTPRGGLTEEFLLKNGF